VRKKPACYRGACSGAKPLRKRHLHRHGGVLAHQASRAYRHGAVSRLAAASDGSGRRTIAGASASRHRVMAYFCISATSSPRARICAGAVRHRASLCASASPHPACIWAAFRFHRASGMDAASSRIVRVRHAALTWWLFFAHRACFLAWRRVLRVRALRIKRR